MMASLAVISILPVREAFGGSLDFEADRMAQSGGKKR
jgi:hypothetical protein